MNVCRHCGRWSPREVNVELLEQAVREAAAVDRAVLARRRATERQESPYQVPSSVAAKLGRPT
jgi:hypothetical protein